MAERVWIYVISRNLSSAELKSLTDRCQTFVSTWTAHEQQLKASFEIFRDRILIIKVDESAYNASGCSIDKQLQFVKKTEQDLNIELLNRMLVAYEDGNEIKVVHSSKVKELLQQGALSGNTMVFDTTISSSEQFPSWKKHLKDTWLSKYLPSYSS